MKPVEWNRTRALVTGASSGIGREIALQLAAEGANLALVARREDRLRALATEVEADHGVTAVPVPVDLSEPGAAVAIRDHLAGTPLDPPDVIVLNAGIGDTGELAELPVDRVGAVVDVNVRTHAELARLYLPSMIERRTGGILAIASMAGLQPVPYMALYGASKAFLVSLCEALHHEVRDYGVRVTCVCPGPVRTDFFDANAMKVDSELLAKASDPGNVATFAIDAFERNGSVSIPTFAARVMSWIPRILPRWLSGRLALRVMRQRMRAAESEAASGRGD